MNKEELNEMSIEYILSHGSNNQIISAIHSAVDYCDEPEYVLQICQRFYNHSDLWVRKATIDVLSLIDYSKLKEDYLETIVEILSYAFKHDNYEAESAFYAVCEGISKKQKFWLKEQLKEFYGKFNLSQYDYLFASDELIRESVCKVQKRESELEFCCKDMRKAFINKTVDYNMRFREYYINCADDTVLDIKYCPWCSFNLGDSLMNKYYRTLEKESDISIPDLINFTNIPDEFKTDEWWRKRGL